MLLNDFDKTIDKELKAKQIEKDKFINIGEFNVINKMDDEQEYDVREVKIDFEKKQIIIK